MEPTTEVAFNWDAPLVTTLDYSELRQQFSPKQWKNYVAQNCPELDPAEEYQLRSQEKRDTEDSNRVMSKEACLKKNVKIGENSLTGDSTFGFARCHCVDCPFCGPLEISNYVNKINQAIQSKGPLRILRDLTHEQKQSLMRKYKGPQVESNPFNTEAGVAFDVLVRTDDPIGEPYKEATREDAEKWLQPVYGYNKSGKLLKISPPKKDEEDGPTIEVVTQIQYVDFSGSNEKTGQNKSSLEWAKIVIDLAILETINLRPTDAHSLTSALFQRRQARERIIEKIGGVVFGTEYRKYIINSDKLDWSQSANRVEIEANRLKSLRL